MKKLTWFRFSVGIYLAAEAALYLSFLLIDLQGGAPLTVWLKYAGILMCFVMALISAGCGGEWSVATALGLTAAADTLLLVMDTHYAAGVLIFLGVQLLYLYRLRRADRGRWLPGLRGAAVVLLLAGLWGLGQVRPLNVLAVIYFSTLACNAAQSFQSRAAWRQMFGIGLLLFACCDLCVGIYNSPGLAPEPLYAFARIGMWLFYLPSQVLIVCSGLLRKEE